MWKGHERPQPQRRRAALRQGAEKTACRDHSPMYMPCVLHRQGLQVHPGTCPSVSRHTVHMLLSAQACVFRALVLEAEGHASHWQKSVLSPWGWERALAKWSSLEDESSGTRQRRMPWGSPQGQGCSPIAYGGGVLVFSQFASGKTV